MKILIATNRKQSYNVQRLRKEARHLGHKTRTVYWKEILFHFKRKSVNIKISKTGYDISNYDYLIARSPTFPSSKKSIKKTAISQMSRLYEHFLIISKYLKRRNVGALNGKVKSMPHYTKLSQYYTLAENDLPVVPSLLYTGGKIVRKVYENFSFPYIIKSTKGSLGKDVFKINDIGQIKELMKRYGRGSLFAQKYIPIREDYRILVLGGKVLGGMKRIAPANKFQTNIHGGGEAQQIEVDDKMANLARKAAKVFNADLVGVDIVKDKSGKYYIFEVNLFPIFKGFEEATDINVAKKIIRFIEERYESEHREESERKVKEKVKIKKHKEKVKLKKKAKEEILEK